MDITLSTRLKNGIDMLKSDWQECQIDDVFGVDHYYSDGITDGCTVKIIFSKKSVHIATVFIREDGSYIFPWNKHKEIEAYLGKWINLVKQQCTSVCTPDSTPSS